MDHRDLQGLLAKKANLKKRQYRYDSHLTFSLTHFPPNINPVPPSILFVYFSIPLSFKTFLTLPNYQPCRLSRANTMVLTLAFYLSLCFFLFCLDLDFLFTPIVVLITYVYLFLRMYLGSLFYFCFCSDRRLL